MQSKRETNSRQSTLSPNAQPELFLKCRSLIGQAESLAESVTELLPHKDFSFAGLQEQLDEPFSIFVCGEFNSGKSTLLNTLAGEQLAPVGVLPTTKEIVNITSSKVTDVSFIDSPGTNSIIKEHQNRTTSYLKRTDLILFVTSVERPLSDSEMHFLEEVRNTWSRKLVVAINKSDLLSKEENEQIVDYVSQGLRASFGISTPLFLISARSGSGLQELTDYLNHYLSDVERIKLKLSGPPHSLLVYADKLSPLLLASLRKVEHDISAYQKVISRVETRIEEGMLISRGHKDQLTFLFENLETNLEAVIENYFGLFTLVHSRISGKDHSLRTKISSVIEDIRLDEKTKQIVQDAAAQSASHRERVLSEAREDLSHLLSSSVEELAVANLKPEGLDAKRLAEELRDAASKGLNRFVTMSSLAAATGIGMHVAATAALVELSGFVAMMTLGIIGLRALPREKRRAKKELKELIKGVRQSFSDALSAEFLAQSERFIHSIRKQLNPAISLLETRQAELKIQEKALSELRLEIERYLLELSRS